MTKYNYNIRCKTCRRGFNPITKRSAFVKLCDECYKINKINYDEYNKTRVKNEL